MKFHDIFASLPEHLAFELFGYLNSSDKAAYQNCVSTLAQQRKLRAVFVQRKPAQERFLWLQKQASKPLNESLTATLLQVWLTGMHAPMLAAFLDGLGIEHDGKGSISDLPAEPEAVVVQAAVEKLLENYPHDLVGIYLNAFEAMDEGNWPGLKALLDQDSRLMPATASS